MKRLNVSILAVVAILAIGLTAFTKAETSKRVATPNCYEVVTGVYELNCDINSVPLVGLNCTDAKAEVGKGLLVAPNTLTALECEETASIFCCAKLIVDPFACAGQPAVEFIDENGFSRNAPAQISQVFCKAD